MAPNLSSPDILFPELGAVVVFSTSRPAFIDTDPSPSAKLFEMQKAIDRP